MNITKVQLNLFNRNVQRKIKRNSDISIVNIIPKEEIMTEFFTNYVRICSIPEFAQQYLDEVDCIQNLVFPTYDIQVEIMETLKNINNEIDISEISPYLIYYITHDDADNTSELLMAYQEYKHALNILLTSIHNIIKQNT
jgi:hypothetical protein